MISASELLLESYGDPGLGFVISVEGAPYRMAPAGVDTGLLAAGYASVVKVGLKQRVSMLAAIFARDERLWLLLGDRRFDLSDNRVTTRKSAPWPFVRKFSLFFDNVEAASLVYWMTRLDERYWPTQGDIFSYVVDVTRTAAERYRYMRAWTLSQQGKRLSDPSTFAQLEAEMEAYRKQAQS